MEQRYFTQNDTISNENHELDREPVTEATAQYLLSMDQIYPIVMDEEPRKNGSGRIIGTHYTITDEAAEFLDDQNRAMGY